MILEISDYREILQRELQKRRDVNPAFSLRAFAMKLKIPPSSLSEILNRKTGLSLTKARFVGAKLNLSELEQEYFVTLVESVHARAKRDRELAKIRLLKFQQIRDKHVNMDSWNLISNWYHAGVVELSKVRGFKSEPPWIAAKLGISTPEARAACDRLVRLGILRREGTRLKATGQWLLNSPHETPSDCIKGFHQTMLAKAATAIYQQPLAERNYSSLLMAIDASKMDEAKTLIMEFNRRLSQLMTAAAERDSLYCFSTQLFKIDESTP
jgi:uncharacterized protein (TIGR02147 family)